MLGSEFTLDVFYCFSGKYLHWDWKYLGKKDYAGYLDGRWDKYTNGKPHGCAPAGKNMEIRTTYVVELKARYPHPYSKKYIWFDAQTMRALGFVAFDSAQRLWKTYYVPYIWSDSPDQVPDIFPNWGQMTMNGQRMPMLNGPAIIYDHQKDRASISAIIGSHWTVDYDFKAADKFYTPDTLRKLGR